MNIDEAGEKIASEILDSLRMSTWRDLHPAAYRSLLNYQRNIEKSVRRVLACNTLKYAKRVHR